MIRNRKELVFFLRADLMMNRGYFSRSFIRKVYELFCPDLIMEYLRAMRKYSYYQSGGCIFKRILCLWYKRRYLKLGYKLGFSIGENVFGYALVLPHHGTIVVGNDNVIGNYACIHTSTLIIQNGSTIGNGLFLGSGAKITKSVKMGNNVWIGANSVVGLSCDSDVMLAGIPAIIKKKIQGGWYQYLYSEAWHKRYTAIENLKQQSYIGG